MLMQSYIITHPRDESFKVRLYARKISNHPLRDTHYKCVVQPINHDGRVLAERPIAEEFKTPEELQAWIETTQNDGWLVRKDGAE